MKKMTANVLARNNKDIYHNTRIIFEDKENLNNLRLIYNWKQKLNMYPNVYYLLILTLIEVKCWDHGSSNMFLCADCSTISLFYTKLG